MSSDVCEDKTQKYLRISLLKQANVMFSYVFLQDGGLGAPTDLVTSEVTHTSFRASWTGPSEPVDRYRIQYMTVSGTQPREVSPVVY